MDGFFTNLGARLRNAARATAFSVMGVVLGLVGLGFLTVALWILLAAHEGVLVAHAVIGALYLVLGFCLMAIGAQGGRSRSERPPGQAPPASPTKDPLVQLAEAFAVGIEAGRAMRKPHD